MEKRDAGAGVDSKNVAKVDAHVQAGGWRARGGAGHTTGGPGIEASGDLLGGYQRDANIKFGMIDYPIFGAGLYRCESNKI